MAETGERLVRWERTHTPDPEKHELYQDSRDKWQAVYQDQLGLVDHGLTTSLWKAPGYSFIDSHIMMTVAVSFEYSYSYFPSFRAGLLKASLQIHRSITSTIFKGKLLFFLKH